MVQVEQLGERLRLALRVVGLQLELGERERLRVAEQLVEPVARRMELDAVARARRDERPPAAVLLHAQLELVGPRERRGEVVLVERDADVVDARDVPLPRLDDDVHRAALELGQPQLEAEPVEVLPGDARLVARVLVADPPVAGDELEAELGEVPGLDLADPVRH